MNVSRVVVMNRDEEDAIMEAVAQSTMEEDQKHIEEVMKEESEKKFCSACSFSVCSICSMNLGESSSSESKK